jgi:hypothetical protein
MKLMSFYWIDIKDRKILKKVLRRMIGIEKFYLLES